MESNANRFRFAGWPEPSKPQHRGISGGGQYCTDNDCRCQQYDWKQGPYFQSDAGVRGLESFQRALKAALFKVEQELYVAKIHADSRDKTFNRTYEANAARRGRYDDDTLLVKRCCACSTPTVCAALGCGLENEPVFSEGCGVSINEEGES
jgi:hypothetical protein